MLRFGTDGVRGDADTDLTPALVSALGTAAARVLDARTFLVGRDTRESGPRIVDDLIRGFGAAGAAAHSLGVASTPAIAFLAQRAGLPAAIVSASHNVWSDNGVKLVGPDGRKLADEQETAIEAALLEVASQTLTSSGSVPQERAVAVPDGVDFDAYVDHLLGALDGRILTGVHIMLDCANGAASELAPRALVEAGARVDVLHDAPNGRNINDACGSTYPQELQAAVLASGADLGLALDGDADRVVAVDEQGELVDGDQLMVMTALDWHERGILRNDAIVVTVMSNLGLRRALSAAGVGIVETPVGDRQVTAAMAAHDIAIGGEQSGHIVFGDLATTGDGVLTGIIVADLVARRREPLSKLAGAMTRLPQVLVSVPLADGKGAADAPAVQEAVRKVEAALSDRGRVMVRSSGTEPVVRVMVEAPTEAEAKAAAEEIRAALER